jgi:16S rRNA G966 N2-methylase RsmD
LYQDIQENNMENSIDNNYDNNVETVDAWDEAINDNDFIIKNKISRIFPLLKNSSNYTKLLIDEESFSFITIREIAELTSKIISYHLIKNNVNPQKTSIIDYTAGVGGNILSFSKYFNNVYAVEIDKVRTEYLQNNLNIYNQKNVIVINESSIDYNNKSMLNIKPNTIFIDPPWGGTCYRKNDLLRLTLSDVPIEELVLDIFDKFRTINISPLDSYSNRLVVLKLPKNYDIENFYNYIKKNTVGKNYIIMSYIYILNKMFILVCEYKTI